MASTRPQVRTCSSRSVNANGTRFIASLRATTVAVVTGGTRASARHRRSAASLGAHGGGVRGARPHAVEDFVPCDVRDAEQVDSRDRGHRRARPARRAGQQRRRLARGRRRDASPRFSAAIIELNLLAPLHFAQRANAVMQKQETGGLIVNIASVSGAAPVAGHRRVRRRQGRAS